MARTSTPEMAAVERQIQCALHVIPLKYRVALEGVFAKQRARRATWLGRMRKPSAHTQACFRNLHVLNDGEIPNKESISRVCREIGEQNRHHAFWAELLAEIEYLEMLLEIVAP